MVFDTVRVAEYWSTISGGNGVSSLLCHQTSTLRIEILEATVWHLRDPTLLHSQPAFTFLGEPVKPASLAVLKVTIQCFPDHADLNSMTLEDAVQQQDLFLSIRC